ncbi:MAG: hypothetical protein XD72_1499 [Methanothrix harundinacea]|jgi:hypothetical protein|uniref:Uncharacterized protein n=1 Tax=Methanothrix harundinacea TaxID=301375 RepID=A0A101FTH8_9EURY|nr:MAG: hypothetical protein XD72_1499 [Methanothrix harundinacea]KUK95514.1 MAG: hypothetical protein XE07_1770 [Methanothrix harundinacea]
MVEISGTSLAAIRSKRIYTLEERIQCCIIRHVFRGTESDHS